MGVRVGLHWGVEVGATDCSGGPEFKGLYVAAIVMVVGASEAIPVRTMVRVGTTLVGYVGALDGQPGAGGLYEGMDEMEVGMYVGAYDGVQDNVIVGVSVGGFDGAVDGKQVGFKLRAIVGEFVGALEDGHVVSAYDGAQLRVYDGTEVLDGGLVTMDQGCGVAYN